MTKGILAFCSWRTSLSKYACCSFHPMVADSLSSKRLPVIQQTSLICFGPPQPVEMLKFAVCLGVYMVGALELAFTDQGWQMDLQSAVSVLKLPMGAGSQATEVWFKETSS
jgi:hypothetical protein